MIYRCPGPVKSVPLAASPSCFEVGEALPDVAAHDLGQRAHIRPVDLDQVLGGVAQIELHLVIGYLEQVIAARVVEAVRGLGLGVDVVEFVDLEGEMRFPVPALAALEQMDLRDAELQPGRGETEVRRRQPLGAEDVLEEGDRALQIERAQTDMRYSQDGHGVASSSCWTVA